MPILAVIRANLLACVLGLVAAIFLVISVVQSVELNGFLWIDGVRDKLERVTIDNNELRAELKSISDAKDKQKAETSKRVEQAERGEREAKPIADKIRAALASHQHKPFPLLVDASANRVEMADQYACMRLMRPYRITTDPKPTVRT